MNWGNTSSVEYLDTTHYSFLDYYGTLVKTLVEKMNYTRGIDVRGAPYDFRKAPSKFENFSDIVFFVLFMRSDDNRSFNM